MSYATAQLHLTLEQVAEIIRQLTEDQQSALEELLDTAATAEILRRSADNSAPLLSHKQLRQQFSA